MVVVGLRPGRVRLHQRISVTQESSHVIHGPTIHGPKFLGVEGGLRPAISFEPNSCEREPYIEPVKSLALSVLRGNKE